MLKQDMEIAVVIPLYNKKSSIERTLDSVLKQSYLPKEIIVVNDGSTDGSAQLVANFNHPLIQLVHQKNAGVAAARNKGVTLAKSNWIAFLDADDEWHPAYLQTINQLYIKYDQAMVFATNYAYRLYQGEMKPTQINNLAFDPSANDGILSNYFQVAATSNPPICASSVVVAKRSLIDIGGFPIGIKSGEDLITWARLAINYKIAYSIKPLATFVLAAAHSYNEKPNRVPQIPDYVGAELKKIYQANKDCLGLRNYLAHWHKMRASIYLRLGYRWKGLREIKNSLGYSFFNLKVWIYLLLTLLPVSWTNQVFRLAK